MTGPTASKPSPLREVPFKRGVEEIYRVFHEDGAVKIPHVFAPELMEVIDGEVATCIEQSELKWGGRVHLTDLINISPTFRKHILGCTSMHAVFERILRPDHGEYWMNSAQIFHLDSGTAQQPIHRDNHIYYSLAKFLPPGSTELLVNMMVALTPFREDNGATRVVVGSHRWPIDRQASSDEASVAEMEPGDVLLFSGWTLHMGGENVSKECRRGLNITMHPGCLTPVDCHMFTPREIVENMTKLEQRMIGWRSLPAVNGYHWSLRGQELGEGLNLKCRPSTKDN